MFRLNAPVVIKVKVKKKKNAAICNHALLRIHIIGGQRLMEIALLHHHSSLAARDFQSSISVEAPLWGCHLDG